jgi:hypothetical protein
MREEEREGFRNMQIFSVIPLPFPLSLSSPTVPTSKHTHSYVELVKVILDRLVLVIFLFQLQDYEIS